MEHSASVADNAQLTFWEHILVLRKYLLWAGALFTLSAIAIYTYSDELLIHYLLRPLNGESLVFLSPLGPFLFKIKVAFMGAFVVCLPLWLILISHFIGEALPSRKRGFFYVFIAAITLLGFISVAVTYLYLVPVSLAALSQFTVPGTTYMLTAESYLSFVLMSMTVAFLVLELPIVVIALSYIRLINPHVVGKHRRFVFIGLIIILAILTPTTDPVTLLMVAIPAMLLTEVGLVVAKEMYTREATS